MTFPPPDIFHPPQYNDSDNASSQPRISRTSPPSAATATAPFPPPRHPKTYNPAPRPRRIAMTISAGGGGGMAVAKRSDIPTEFCIPVELYLSPKASVALRKVCSSLPPRTSFPSPIRLAFCQTSHNRIHHSHGYSSPFFPRSFPSLSVVSCAYSPPVRGAWKSASKVTIIRPFRVIPATDNSP